MRFTSASGRPLLGSAVNADSIVHLEALGIQTTVASAENAGLVTKDASGAYVLTEKGGAAGGDTPAEQQEQEGEALTYDTATEQALTAAADLMVSKSGIVTAHKATVVANYIEGREQVVPEGATEGELRQVVSALEQEASAYLMAKHGIDGAAFRSFAEASHGREFKEAISKHVSGAGDLSAYDAIAKSQRRPGSARSRPRPSGWSGGSQLGRKSPTPSS